MLKEKAWRWIEDNKQGFIEVADKVWHYAELGLVETKSSKLIAEVLERHGFDVQLGVAGMPTAIYATWGKGEPTIGFQGEYDALPGISNKVKPEKDPLVPGAPGHGCGHNVHGATALACVVALRHVMEEEGLPGTLKFYGTPAEENYGGKVFMVRPNVVPDYARSWYYIRAPERGQLDPIYKRIIKIAEGAALMTETELEVQFIDGLYNKIPCKGLADLVVKNMREVSAPEWSEEELGFAAKIAGQFSRQSKIDAMRKAKVPDWERYVDVDLMTDILDPWGEGETSPGSSDVGDVSWVCPTLEFGTACNVLGAPGHSWAFVACCGSTIGHKSLVFAAKVMAGAALEVLTDENLRYALNEEHEERLKGRTYKTPLPEGLQPPLEIARENWEKIPKQ